MSCKIGNAQSRATFFRHFAVLSLPAVLLRKLPNSSYEPPTHTERISRRAEAFICKFIDGYSNDIINIAKKLAGAEHPFRKLLE